MLESRFSIKTKRITRCGRPYIACYFLLKYLYTFLTNITKIWGLHFCGTTSIFRTFFRTYWSAADEETNNITRQIQIYSSVYNTGTEMYRWWNVQRVTYLYISVTLCKVNRQPISASEIGENFLHRLREKYRTLCSNRHEHRKSALPFVTSKRIKAPQLSAPLCLT